VRYLSLGAEAALGCGDGPPRLLIIPALLDEANKLRRFTVQTMRALADAGVASVLPDLPGCNESPAPLAAQTLAGWREAMRAAAAQFGVSHVLAIRGGALADPGTLPAFHYAPVSGAAILRAMLRAAVMAEREAGRGATREGLLERGLADGLVLAGHHLGAAMVAGLDAAQPPAATVIPQAALGGPALWLRAEPGEDEGQSLRLSEAVAAAL
jgi:hypothetical protein